MFEKASLSYTKEISDLHSKAVEQIFSAAYPPEIIGNWNAGRTLEGLKKIIITEDFYVLRDNGNIEGFIHFSNDEIIGLFLRLDCIGKGLGRKLFEFAVSEIDQRPIKLLVSLNAVDFYKHMGCISKGHTTVRRNERDIYFLKMEYA
jgi:GNAT superfamily N-acetyltransferase